MRLGSAVLTGAGRRFMRPSYPIRPCQAASELALEVPTGKLTAARRVGSQKPPNVAMPIIRFSNLIPILDVRDMDKALRYYVDLLGFQAEFRYKEDPNNYAGVRRDSVSLHLQWQHEDHFKAGTAGRLRVRINVSDPDALFEEYRRNGVLDENVQVRSTDWETREFGFRDFDGNGLIFYRDS
jgi:catechol 2,3-dioxygenase-like lactoylglutathione lyase family enzyme